MSDTITIGTFVAQAIAFGTEAIRDTSQAQLQKQRLYTSLASLWEAMEKAPTFTPTVAAMAQVISILPEADQREIKVLSDRLMAAMLNDPQTQPLAKEFSSTAAAVSTEQRADVPSPPTVASVFESIHSALKNKACLWAADEVSVLELKPSLKSFHKLVAEKIDARSESEQAEIQPLAQAVFVALGKGIPKIAAAPKEIVVEGDLIISNVKGPVRLRNIRAGGSITFSDITAG